MERRSDMRNVRMTSLDKALEVCEVLGASPDGASVSDVARATRQPASTVHRLLAVLKRRGYVRQDRVTSRYALSLKMLDLSFRSLGRSDLRVHAFPLVRHHVASTGDRSFVAVAAAGEVSYVWRTGPDEVQMHSTHGRAMPAHCAEYFAAGTSDPSLRALSCLRLDGPTRAAPERLGEATAAGGQRLTCTCAPVRDHAGREVARIGLFAHASDEGDLVARACPIAATLAGEVSQRLGYMPAASLAVTA